MTINGNQVKRYRLAKGLTQIELGKEIGRDGNWISDVEHGRYLSIRNIDLVDLSKALDVPVEELQYNPAKKYVKQFVTMIKDCSEEQMEQVMDLVKKYLEVNS